jgi:hypothetical protein
VKPTVRLQTVEVTADGEGLVSHAGAGLLGRNGAKPTGSMTALTVAIPSDLGGLWITIWQRGRQFHAPQPCFLSST